MKPQIFKQGESWWLVLETYGFQSRTECREHSSHKDAVRELVRLEGRGGFAGSSIERA